MSTQDIETVRKYRDVLIDLGLPINKVVVFGSRAVGKGNKWSDLDVCIVSPLFDVDRQAERSFLINVSRKVSDDIEPHPMTERELDNKFNPLANEIKKYGITI